MPVGRLLLLLLIATFSLWQPMGVRAEFPADGPQQLETILAQKQFQPRVEQLNFLERLKRQVLVGLSRAATKTIQRIKDLTEKLTIPAWVVVPAKWVEYLLAAAADLIRLLLRLGTLLLQIAVILVGLYVIRLLVRKLRRDGPVGEADYLAADSAAGAAGGPEPVLPLNGDSTIAQLEVWRRRLRAGFYSRQGVSPALTDRQVARLNIIPPVEMAEFRQIGGLFERAIFAGRPVQLPEGSTAKNGEKPEPHTGAE